MTVPNQRLRPSAKAVLVPFLLAILTFLTFSRILRSSFVDLDDPRYVTQNEFVGRGLCLASIEYAFTTFDTGNWIPLTWMSYLTDAQLFGINSTAFHATNLGFHIANVLLFFFLLQTVTRAFWRSAVVAALFAVHPLHVESIAWVSERKDVLSGFWLLVTLFAYARYCQNLDRWRYLLVVTCFIIGLLAKPMLVTVPILMLLLDVWPLGRSEVPPLNGVPSFPVIKRTWRALLLEKIPLLLISLADGLISVASQSSVDAISNLGQLPAQRRIENATTAVVWYVSKTFCPTNLCAFYLRSNDAPTWHAVAISAATLFAISLAVTLYGGTRKYLTVGWWWFVLSLLPVIGLIPVGSQLYADRYSYIPHIGLLIMIVWVVADQVGTRPLLRTVAICLAAVSITFCAIVSYHQTAYWQNSEALWQRVLSIEPDNEFAHYHIGTLRQSEGRLDEALVHFNQLLTKHRNNPDLLNNIGLIHQQRKEHRDAEAFFRAALRVNPRHPIAQRNLSSLLGLKSEARAATQKTQITIEALQKNEAGMNHARNGQFQLALNSFTDAISASPQFVDAYINCAVTLEQLGKASEAKSRLEQAIAIDPENFVANLNLAAILEFEGDLNGARRHLEAARDSRPDDFEVRNRLRDLQQRLPER